MNILEFKIFLNYVDFEINISEENLSKSIIRKRIIGKVPKNLKKYCNSIKIIYDEKDMKFGENKISIFYKKEKISKILHLTNDRINKTKNIIRESLRLIKNRRRKNDNNNI